VIFKILEEKEGITWIKGSIDYEEYKYGGN
jgi:hypothetical protein